MKQDTSWEEVAPWYDEHLKDADTYHAKVLLPNLMRILNLSGKERVLDLACGQGYFTREIAKSAVSAVGTDLSPTLIAFAKKNSDKKITYEVSEASKLSFAKNGEFDVVLCVLALQNIEHLQEVCAEVRRVLSPRGRFLFVLNHPAFRIPKKSSWGFDEKGGVQYRRVDAYLSGFKEKMDMTPGSLSAKTFTYSFHRSLQDYMKALRASGFSITRLEEWISHKKSQQGPRMKTEDRARKEFPLFLCIEAEPQNVTIGTTTN